MYDLYALDGGHLRIPLPEHSLDGRALDLEKLSDGGLLVLDRTNKQIFRFDKQLRSIPPGNNINPPESTFQPVEGPVRYQPAASPSSPAVISIDLTTNNTSYPVAITALPDGSFLLLEQDTQTSLSQLRYFPNSFQPGDALPTAFQLKVTRPGEDETAAPIEDPINAYDIAYVPELDGKKKGQLVVVDRTGKQAYRFRLETLEPLNLSLEPRYYPMRDFDGVAITTDWQTGEAYYHQASHLWLTLKALPRQRYKTTEASLELPAMDGREPGCLWHRLCIDACVPPGTGLRVAVRAAEQSDRLKQAAWQAQPEPYRRRGAEVPHGSLWSEQDLGESHVGTWELLFQEVRGRYVEIRLTLVGNRRSSPFVRALRAHYPRFSYLREYLPGVYQQDLESMSFLDRFLANPEGLLTTLEGTIAQAQTLFDVRTVSESALAWLADWVGLALEKGWNDYQRRLLIDQSAYFFQRRGTRLGLLQAILLTLYPEFGPQIFSDDAEKLCPQVRIVEQFVARRYSSVAAGDPTESKSTQTDDQKKDAYAHRFAVLVPTTVSATQKALLERIINLEKPAHTAFVLKEYWALFRVGEVRLEIDTLLGQGGKFDTFRLGQSALAEATLTETFPYNLTNRTVLVQ